jgi:Flp pilus assembly pilin Flp
MFNRKGQNTAEYAILIALIIAAAIGMQTYVKRGLQARLHDESKNFVNKLASNPEWANISDVATSAEIQFEPEQLSRQATQDVLEDTAKSTMEKGGVVTREVTKRTKQAAGDYQKYEGIGIGY